MIRKTRNKIINKKNKNLAIPAAALAIPKNPNTPAMIATTRKNIAHFNIFFILLVINYFTDYIIIEKY